MAILKFRVFWEDDDQIYRDIEIQGNQSFHDLHLGIVKAYEFDGKHPASFFESNDKWIPGREISSEVLVNKKNAPALSMVKTPVSALVTTPEQKFVYIYKSEKKWTFLAELIGVNQYDTPRRIYPFVLRKEGIAPAQYGIKGVHPSKIVEIEEKYDLGAAALVEGFGSEGDDDGEEKQDEEKSDEETTDDETQLLGLD
jgi:Plasmid pRiA4b ORF-3-like protein